MEEPTDLGRLIGALEGDDVAAVERILASSPTLVNEPIDANLADGVGRSQTLLHRAMPGDGRPLTQERLRIVSLLLEHGARVDAPGHGPNHGTCTALTLAAWGGHVALVERLLAAGADVEGSPDGLPEHRPVRTASRHGHRDATEALLGAGADHGLEDLLMAGLEARILAHLEEHPDALTERLADGGSPLHVAMTTGPGVALVPTLLAHGADPDATDALGRTALHAAIESDRRELVDRFTERTTSFDVFAAAGLGDAERVARSLEARPQLADATQADGVTPLFYAAHSGCVDSATALLDAGSPPSPRSHRFWACMTPLHLAIQRRHTAVTQLLIERGADVDACGASPDRYGPTPLHVAARWGGVDEVRLLLDHGADMNVSSGACGASNDGVLGWVLYAGQVDVLRLLLDRRLDPRRELDGRTLQEAAHANGHDDLAKLLE